MAAKAVPAAGYYGTLLNELAGLATPASYVNGLRSFGNNVSTIYNDGGLTAAHVAVVVDLPHQDAQEPEDGEHDGTRDGHRALYRHGLDACLGESGGAGARRGREGRRHGASRHSART